MMSSKAILLLGLAATMLLLISSEARDLAETSKETTNELATGGSSGVDVGEVKAGCPICCIRGKCGCCAPPQQAEELATSGGYGGGSSRGDSAGGGGGCNRKCCNNGRCGCCSSPHQLEELAN